MIDEGDGIGSVTSTAAVRRVFAQDSACWNRGSSVYCELFPEESASLDTIVPNNSSTAEAGTSIETSFNRPEAPGARATKASLPESAEKVGVVISGRFGVNQVVNGRYHQHEVGAHGRPSYAKPPVAGVATDRNLAIWWCAGKWTIGVLDEFGSEAGYAYVESDAMCPVNIGGGNGAAGSRGESGGGGNRGNRSIVCSGSRSSNDSDGTGGGGNDGCGDNPNDRDAKQSNAWMIWDGKAWERDKLMQCVRLGEDHNGPLSPAPREDGFATPPCQRLLVPTPGSSSNSSLASLHHEEEDGNIHRRGHDHENRAHSRALEALLLPQETLSDTSAANADAYVDVAAAAAATDAVDGAAVVYGAAAEGQSAIVHDSIFAAVAAGDIGAMLGFLNRDPSLLNVVRSSDGHNLVILAANSQQPGCLASLVEHGAAHKYHGAAPHFHGHHLSILESLDDELDALQALAEARGRHNWTRQESQDRIKLLAKVFARLAPSSLPAMLEHIPPLPSRTVSCNIERVLLALKNHTVNHAAPLRAARALMDLTLPSQLAAVLTMVRKGAVRSIKSAVEAQIERTRLGPTSVLTFITLARYFSSVLCRIAIDVTVETKAGRHDPRKQCVEEGIIELAVLLINQHATLRDAPLSSDQREIINAGKGALLQVLAELSFNLEDTGSRIVACGTFEIAVGMTCDVHHGEIATMATWCLFNLLEMQDYQNQVANATAKDFARAVLLHHPGHRTAEDLLGKATAPSWMCHTPCRTAACNDDVESLLLLLLKADVENDYTDLHRPDENGKPPIAAAATAANMSPCDSLIMLAERGSALKHHSGPQCEGRHHVEKIASCEMDFELLCRIGELAKPLQPVLFAERGAAITRIRSRFAPPKASDSMVQSLAHSRLSREEIDALPQHVKNAECTLCKSPVDGGDDPNPDPDLELVRLDPCGCIHHKTCVVDWVSGNRASCPLCKVPLEGAWPSVPDPPIRAVDSVEWIISKMRSEIEDENLQAFGCRCLMDLALTSLRRAKKVASPAGLQQVWRAMNVHPKSVEVQHRGGYVALEAAIQLRNAADAPYEELVKIAILGIWHCTNRGFGNVPTADEAAWATAAETNVRVLTELAFSTRLHSHAAAFIELEVTDRVLALLAVAEYHASEAVLSQASSFLRSLINAGGELEDHFASNFMLASSSSSATTAASGLLDPLPQELLSRRHQVLNPPAGLR